MGDRKFLQGRNLIVLGFTIASVGLVVYFFEFIVNFHSNNGRAFEIDWFNISVPAGYALAAWSWWWMATSIKSVVGKSDPVLRALRGFSVQSFVLASGLLTSADVFRSISLSRLFLGTIIEFFGVLITGIGFWRLSYGLSQVADPKNAQAG